MEIIGIKKNWGDAMAGLRKFGITEATYNTWLLGLEPDTFNEGVLTVRIPSDTPQMVTYYTKKYKEMLEHALQEYFKEPVTVKFVSRREEQNNDSPRDQKTKEESCPQAWTSERDALPNRYRFENFIVGDSNRFAYMACLNAANNIKNGASNPIYLVGGTGVGKTHLLRAFQLHAFDIEPQIKTKYFSGDRFAAIVKEAIQNAELNSLYDEFMQKDLFIIDGVEALNGDIDVQRAFKYVYDEFYARKKQLLFSSTVPPEDIMFVEDWIRFRLEGSLVLPIGTQDEKMRLEILLAQNEKLGSIVSQDVLEETAEEFTSVTRIKGLIITMAEYLKLSGPPYDTARMRRELSSMYDASNDEEE